MDTDVVFCYHKYPNGKNGGGMHAMEITFVNPGIEKMLENILLFQTDGTAAFWYEPLFYFYPQLDKARALSMRGEERKNYLARELRQAYAGLEKTIDEKVVLYSRHWERCRPQVTAALSDAFKVDCATMFNDIKCSVTMNPIAPRFLRQRAFDVFTSTAKGAPWAWRFMKSFILCGSMCGMRRLMICMTNTKARG